jgi:hypothetical protein
VFAFACRLQPASVSAGFSRRLRLPPALAGGLQIIHSLVLLVTAGFLAGFKSRCSSRHDCLRLKARLNKPAEAGCCCIVSCIFNHRLKPVADAEAG